MNPNLDSVFMSQLAELAALIPDVPRSPLPQTESNVPGSKVRFSGRGQDVRVAYDLAIAQRRQLVTQKKSVEATLSSISRALERHDLFIKHHKPFLSSYRRLPPEVWTMIFEEATLADAKTDAGRTFLNADVTMAPFSISHVCAEWRTLCLQSPALWTSLRIQIKTQFRASKSKLLNAFLVRGRNEALAISIVFKQTKSSAIYGFSMHEWCYELYESLHPIFRQHLRWRDVHICIPVNVLLISDLFPVANTPLLKSFSLELLPMTIEDGETPPVMPRTLLRNSSALQHLFLHNFFDKFEVHTEERLSTLLDWKHLTSFALCDLNDLAEDLTHNGGSMGLAQTLLLLAPSLRSWNWSFSESSSVAIGADVHISHPNLRSAYLEVRNSAIFSSLELPSLELFSLYDTELRHPLTDTIRNFLRRSPCLEKVEFEWSSSETLDLLDDIGLPLKSVTIRCSSSDYDYSFDSNISILTKANIPSLERVTFVLRTTDDGYNARIVNAIMASRELALHTISLAYHTKISIEAHSNMLEDEANEALMSLGELELPNLEITRV
ncbi:hypothetical protein DL96DRAFT_1631372 [Flagelloscypha sp. PMI_526]|nr:hypothetical protein DL96DRAFT_1631372 [Flagelloscypha sp. PMI_526]